MCAVLRFSPECRKIESFNNVCTEILQQHFGWNKILCKSNLSQMNQIVPCANLSPLLSILGWIIAAVSVKQPLKLQSDRFGIVIIKEIYRTKKILDVSLGKYISPASWAFYTTALVRALLLKWSVWGCVYGGFLLWFAHVQGYGLFMQHNP